MKTYIVKTCYYSIFFSCIFLTFVSCNGLSDNKADCPALSQGDYPAPSNLRLDWSDEFTSWQAAKWRYDLGNYIPGTDVQGWGNNELQYYTSNYGVDKNIYVNDGLLRIRAQREASSDSHGTYSYTSARLKSKHSQTCGLIEIRAKLPEGKGLWPAIWMLPEKNDYGGWAASGEIDILETRGSQPNIAIGTIHYGGAWPNNRHKGKDFHLPNSGSTTDFHTYGILWEKGSITWYIDYVEYNQITSWYTTDGIFPAPFDKDFHLILNVAVGGNFDGNPDSSTSFPADMLIDYVRFYSLTGQ